MKPKTKFRYIRVVLLRHKKHWSISEIASHFDYTKNYIWTILRRPEFQDYTEYLRSGFVWFAKERFKEILKEIKSGTYNKSVSSTNKQVFTQY